MYGEAGQPDKMIVPLSRYLLLRPDDWSAWLDMATLCAMRQQQQQMQHALRKAIELGNPKRCNGFKKTLCCVRWRSRFCDR